MSAAAKKQDSKTQRKAGKLSDCEVFTAAGQTEPYAVRDAREQIAILRAEMLNTLVHYTDAKEGLNIDEVSRTTIEAMTLAISSLEVDLGMLTEGVSQ